MLQANLKTPSVQKHLVCISHRCQVALQKAAASGDTAEPSTIPAVGTSHTYITPGVKRPKVSHFVEPGRSLPDKHKPVWPTKDLDPADLHCHAAQHSLMHCQAAQHSLIPRRGDSRAGRPSCLCRFRVASLVRLIQDSADGSTGSGTTHDRVQDRAYFCPWCWQLRHFGCRYTAAQCTLPLQSSPLRAFPSPQLCRPRCRHMRPCCPCPDHSSSLQTCLQARNTAEFVRIAAVTLPSRWAWELSLCAALEGGQCLND